jgi:hypothetical protein
MFLSNKILRLNDPLLLQIGKLLKKRNLVYLRNQYDLKKSIFVFRFFSESPY